MSLRKHIGSEIDFWQQCMPVAREMAALHGWSLLQTLALLRRGKAIAAKLPIEFAANGFDWVAEEQWPEYLGFNELAPFQVAGHQKQDRINQSDKARMAGFLQQNNIATPQILALVMRSHNDKMLNVPRLNTHKELHAQLLHWCATRANILLKPCFGTHGSGVWAIKNAMILNENGAEVSIDTATDAIEKSVQASNGYGYLAQALLCAHPALQQLNGSDILCTLRLYTLNNGADIAVPFAELKMPRHGNITDNILDGKRGNIVSPVAMDTGQTESAWAVLDKNLLYCQQRAAHHPDTGVCFTDFHVPHWNDAVELAIRTASLYPVSPMLGHDVAITQEGCAILDVNNQTSTPWVAGDHGTRPYLARYFPAAFKI
jgi:Sugar-transfer associated ATP-grasp